MNCILCGGKVARLVKEGRVEEAIIQIENLNSEFDDLSALYLVQRLAKLE